MAAIVSTILVIEKAQPYIEGYAAKALKEEVQELKVHFYELKISQEKGFARLEALMAEAEHELDKDLIQATIQATIKAVRDEELARTP